MFASRRSRFIALLLSVILCGLLGAFVYNLPLVQEKIGWRLSVLRSEIRYAFFPPEEAIFTPNPTVVAIVEATLAAFTPTSSATARNTDTPGPTATPTQTPTSTIEPTPLPEKVELNGIRHEYQKYNNCGPANLAMTLSFWGWDGDQRDTAAFLKPIQDDKNVMPYEMAAYVEQETPFEVLVRSGGDLDLIKRFLAAGIPVLVEKGFDVPQKAWMGHYQLITGYDDARQRVTAQDSYQGGPNLRVAYDQLVKYWQHFNYTYLIIYPREFESKVLSLLGPHADETYNLQHAAQVASDEVFSLTGRAQYFAWFNRGTNLRLLQDYAGAAAAFDSAFELYANLDPDTRPWRVMWYRTDPYWAYFYSARYYDVISLATETLSIVSEIEESFYWRALAKEAVGDVVGAIADLRSSLKYHPDWGPAVAQLERLGATP